MTHARVGEGDWMGKERIFLGKRDTANGDQSSMGLVWKKEDAIDSIKSCLKVGRVCKPVVFFLLQLGRGPSSRLVFLVAKP